MSPSERGGLLIAAQLLRRELEVGNEPQDELEAAAKWIDRQVEIDRRRRVRRGRYRRGRG